MTKLIAKHYIPGREKMYTPGEEIREDLPGLDRLLRLEAVKEVQDPLFQDEDDAATTTTITSSEDDLSSEEETEEMDAPEMDLTEEILPAVEPEEKPKATRKRRG